jgi:glucose-fructose oxidoreductase
MTKRRDFIYQTLAGTLALSTSSFAIPNILQAKNKEKLGVALVGLGYYSTDILAPALQVTNHCELKGIVSGTSSKISTWQKKYNIQDKNVYDYKNFDSIANNPDIDVIYIVLPPSMHAEYSIRAANAGKHVWCEKPMARTVKECQSIIDACNKNKVKLSIGYRMHHEPNTQQIISYRKEKKFGSVKFISASAGYFDGRSNHWKQKKDLGGGAMYDMGVYPLNATRYVTGEDPISIMAQQFTNRPEIYTEVDETMLFQLEFPSGALANCATSFGMSMQRLDVNCEKGWYYLSPFQSYSNIKGEASNGEKLIASIPNQQALQMDNDAQAIKNKKPVLVSGEEGLKDIKVVEAAYQSVKEKRLVKISW